MLHEIEFHGTVVGAKDIGMDLGIVETLAETVGDDEIIDAPAGILLTGLETIRPPGIFHLVRILEAEGVGKAIGQQLAELGSFLVGEARIMTIGFGIFDINLLMGHVQVATEDDGFLGIESLKVSLEIVLPRHAIVKALQAILRIRRIAAHEEEAVHLEGDNTPLMVVHIDTNAVGYIEGFVLCEDSGAGITFLIGIIPVALVALEDHIKLSGLHLRLLKTEEVGIQLFEYLTKTFCFAGTQAIDVPTDEFHIASI